MRTGLLLLLLGLVLSCARPAYAYLDPFTGGTIFQVLYAAVAGALAGVAIFPRQVKQMGGAVVRRLAAALRRLRGKK